MHKTSGVVSLATVKQDKRLRLADEVHSLPSDPALEMRAQADKARPAGSARACINAISVGYLVDPL
jgi:hypothetical protein